MCHPENVCEQHCPGSLGETRRFPGPASREGAFTQSCHGWHCSQALQTRIGSFKKILMTPDSITALFPHLRRELSPPPCTMLMGKLFRIAWYRPVEIIPFYLAELMWVTKTHVISTCNFEHALSWKTIWRFPIFKESHQGLSFPGKNNVKYKGSSHPNKKEIPHALQCYVIYQVGTILRTGTSLVFETWNY